MMKKMMKALIGSCKEVSLLIVKKEEGKLSFTENLKLSMHTFVCAICKRFEKQSARIAEEAKHIHAYDELSAVSKEKMKRLLDIHSA